jgi:hypothetical protein
VSIYLHPRRPLPNQRRVYESYPILADAPWGFGAETAAHTLRLMLSGLFDRFPRLKIILGHQGEGLPFLLPRIESRLRPCQPAARRTSRGRAQSGRHRGRFAHLYAFSGAADQRKKPRQKEGGTSMSGYAGGRLSFSLHKEIQASIALHKAKLPCRPKQRKAPPKRGRVSCRWRCGKGLLPHQGNARGNNRFPRRAKERPPPRTEPVSSLDLRFWIAEVPLPSACNHNPGAQGSFR